MRRISREKLSNYKRVHPLRFHKFVRFLGDQEIVEENFQNFHLPDAMRVVYSDGRPFPRVPYERLKRKRRKVIERPLRRRYQDQLEHAFKLMDESFKLLEMHRDHFILKRIGSPRPVRPSLEIECRDAQDFESCNWNRFCQVWMIYLAALDPMHLFNKDHIIDLDYDENPDPPKDEKEARAQLDKYRSKIYGWIHSGYNIYDDSQPIDPRKPIVVDNKEYTSISNPDGRAPLEKVLPDGSFVHEKKPGFLPKGALLKNSGYMADYSDAVIDQLQTWVNQGVLIHLNQNPTYEESLGPFKTELKLTIEPSKPRLW